MTDGETYDAAEAWFIDMLPPDRVVIMHPDAVVEMFMDYWQERA